MSFRSPKIISLLAKLPAPRAMEIPTQPYIDPRIPSAKSTKQVPEGNSSSKNGSEDLRACGGKDISGPTSLKTEINDDAARESGVTPTAPVLNKLES